jgi:hypothetical protein
MRTTLNLDDDVARQLTEQSRRKGRSVSRVANELLRAGLLAVQQAPVLSPYDPPEVDTGRPLMDVTDIGEVLERLEGG